MTTVQQLGIYKVARYSAPHYNEYDSHIVIAVNPVAARHFAASVAADEGASCWINETDSECKLVGYATRGSPGILLSSFNAG